MPDILNPSPSLPNNTISGNASGQTAQPTGLTVSSVQLLLNQAKQLPRWNAALGRVLSGTGNGRILFIGDSTTLGYESNGSTTGNMKPLSTPTQVSNLLTKAGFTAGWQNFMGDGFATTSSPTTTYDSRVTVGANWFTSDTNNWNLGGEIFSANASGGNLSFAPTVQVDTFTVYYWGFNGSGSVSANINGGTPTVVPTSTGGSAAIQSFNMTGTLGMNTLNLSWSSGAAVFIAGFEAFNSAQKYISCVNAGWFGSTAEQWAAANSFVSNPISPLSPDLTIITLGINDWNAATSINTFTNSLQTLITWGQVTGDVILVSDNVTNSGATQSQQILYDQAMFGVAYNNNCPFIDNWARWNNAAQAVSVGFLSSDQTHPTGVGYADLSRSVESVLIKGA